MAKQALPQPGREIAGSPYLTGLPLPAFSDPSTAFITTLPLTSTTNQVLYTVPAEFVDVPLSLFANYTTDATVANRIVNATAFDASGNVVWLMHSTATQAGGTVNSYAFSAQLSTAYAQGQTQALPLPSTPMQPAWTMTLAAGLQAPGDRWSGVALTVLRVPTMTLPSAPILTLAPAPLIA